jgi:capsular exopolysaccharide synthesis family protein
VTLVMAELRKQQAEVARRVADFASKYGKRHPAMVNARAELADIQKNLKAEQDKISREVQTELKVAEAQVRDLREQIALTERQLARNSGAQVQLKELRTRADTTRATYQDMLDRYQRATEQQHLLRPPARVISAARSPVRPDGKRAILLLGFTALGSLAGGMGLALLLELGRRGYDTAEQLGRATGIPVYGSLPLVRRSRDDSIEAAVFTEAVHRTVARILPPSTVPSGCQVVGITSALPDEGKSTLSLSIGRQLARRGRRVLLIHADLHKELAPAFRLQCEQPEHDLLDLLAGPTSLPLEQALLQDERTGLHVLAARTARPGADGLLASPALKMLLERLRPDYDVIVVDTPPVLAVSDYALIAGLADQLLFVVRWQTTPRRAVRTALREVMSLGLPLRGLVLNRVELPAYRRRAPEDALGFYRETARYYRNRGR